MIRRLQFLMLVFTFFSGAASAQEVATSSKLNVWLPSLPWTLEMDGPGFAVRVDEIKPDGRRYFVAENPKSQVVVSVFLEASKGVVQKEECQQSLEGKVKRNASLSSSPLKGVAYRQNGDMLILEYTLADMDGTSMNQKNVFACIPKADGYVDLHVSKVLFKESDRPAFDALLQSVLFVPKQASTKEAPAGDSKQLMREGSRYYLAQQYREAIPPYQKALDIEKSSPRLERNLWRALVDNLSMAYGITGNLAAAQSTLSYGVSKDPDYPLFYYNLACVAAERGEVRETEKYLKMAVERRQNVIAGESFPDARSDDSFQKLLVEDEFRKFVSDLYGGPK